MEIRDTERRRFILAGPPWRVLVTIALPLVLYNGINNAFSLFDVVIASHISATVVSSVAFISQIQNMLAAIGAGLAAGGGIIIARYFGAGDFAAVRRNSSTLVSLSLGLCALIFAGVIPFAAPFLRLLKMPEDLLAEAVLYFRFEVAILAAVFFNNIYFAIEKAKGNTKVIFKLNILALPLKCVLSVFFVYGLGKGIIYLSLASLASHALITAVAIRNLRRKDDPLRLSLAATDFRVSTIKPIVFLSAPIFLEKFAFSFGKVVVNSMAAVYGSLTVGALGISNRIGALATSPPGGVQDAETPVISQNLGNKNTHRAVGMFYRSFAINVGLGTALFLVMTVFRDPIIALFAKNDAVFAEEIRKIYNYERSATIFLAMSSAAMGLFYGFGKTKIAMILNMIRLFVYRIPPLWIMQRFLNLDSQAVGIAMLVSNAAIGITSTAVAFAFVRRFRKKTDSSE